MDKNENAVVSSIPSEYRPLSAWAYFGYSILFAIPVLGFIFLIIYSFSAQNINRRSFARSYFCGLIIVLVLSLVLIFTGALTAIITAISNSIGK